MQAFDLILDYADYRSIEALRNCCRRFHDTTRAKRASWTLPPMSSSRHHDAVFQYLTWSRLDSGLPFLPTLGELRDESGSIVCMKHQSKRCTNAYCTQSHKHIAVDLNNIYCNGGSHVSYENLLMALTELYGSRFVWKNEIFILKYMEAYGELRDVTHREASRK